jgi:hypothetical protein
MPPLTDIKECKWLTAKLPGCRMLISNAALAANAREYAELLAQQKETGLDLLMRGC